MGYVGVCGVIRGYRDRDKVTLTYEEYAKRLKLTAATVTLNGLPAKVSGVNKQFATVTQLKTGLSAEWSWEAVERIVNRDGKFKS